MRIAVDLRSRWRSPRSARVPDAVRDLRDRARRAVRDLADRARAVLLRHLRSARAEALRAVPYHVFQGGRRRRRRRWPALLAVLALLGAGVAAGLTLAPGERAAAASPRRAADRAAARGRRPAPLAGGGTAPSPLSVRLDDPRDLVRLRFKRRPRSGLLFDLDTGRVLWRRDPTRVLPIASLTKMMTALVVGRGGCRPGSKVRITRAALRYRGSGVGLFRRGRRIGVETMLNGLLLPSGNDAAIALAQQAAGGSVKRFVRADEPARPGDGPDLHALLLARRARQPRQPLVRARPRRARARGAARAAAGADRAPPPGRAAVPDQGRAGSTSTTTTRCCGRATAA